MKHRRYAIPAVLFVCSTMGSAYPHEALQPIDKNPSYLESKVKSVIHVFGDAIKRHDFTAFRQGILVSSLVPQRIAEQELQTQFKQFIDDGVDLTKLDMATPIFDRPAQEDAEHQLTVTGHYPSTPQLNFSLGFIREGSHLGLSSFNLTTGSPPSKDTGAKSSSSSVVPNDPASSPKVEATRDSLGPSIIMSVMMDTPVKQGVTLPADQQVAVTAAIHAFAIGVRNRNMDDFLKQNIVSPRWRQAQTGAQLAVLYHDTIEHGADLAKFDGAKLVVPNSPVLAPGGELTINGLIVAKDKEKLGFRVGFESEAGQLRLINLVVARSPTIAK